MPTPSLVYDSAVSKEAEVETALLLTFLRPQIIVEKFLFLDLSYKIASFWAVNRTALLKIGVRLDKYTIHNAAKWEISRQPDC